MKKLLRVVGKAALWVFALFVFVALFKWQWPSSPESPQPPAASVPTPSPAAKPVEEEVTWKRTAPPKGSLSAPVRTGNQGRIGCFHSERYALAHVTVHHPDGRNEVLKKPVPVGPGRRSNLGVLAGEVSFAFESEDDLPVRVVGNKNCLPSF